MAHDGEEKLEQNYRNLGVQSTYDRGMGDEINLIKMYLIGTVKEEGNLGDT